jgi:hypothetical protein
MFNQIAFLIVSTDKTSLWDNGTEYERNASDVERIYSAKRQRCEPAPCSQRQASSGQRRNLLRMSKSVRSFLNDAFSGLMQVI